MSIKTNPIITVGLIPFGPWHPQQITNSKGHREIKEDYRDVFVHADIRKH